MSNARDTIEAKSRLLPKYEFRLGLWLRNT